MLDKRTREMLDQSAWDQAAGRKCERCKCPNCMDPNINVYRGEKALHVCHYPECGKAYKKTSHLRAHLRGHIGDQPFVRTQECANHDSSQYPIICYLNHFRYALGKTAAENSLDRMSFIVITVSIPEKRITNANTVRNVFPDQII